MWKKNCFGSVVPYVWDQLTTGVGPLNHLWESCHIQVKYSEFFQKQRFQHSLLQDFLLQRNLQGCPWDIFICPIPNP